MGNATTPPPFFFLGSQAPFGGLFMCRRSGWGLYFRCGGGYISVAEGVTFPLRRGLYFRCGGVSAGGPSRPIPVRSKAVLGGHDRPCFVDVAPTMHYAVTLPLA